MIREERDGTPIQRDDNALTMKEFPELLDTTYFSTHVLFGSVLRVCWFSLPQQAKGEFQKVQLLSFDKMMPLSLDDCNLQGEPWTDHVNGAVRPVYRYIRLAGAMSLAHAGEELFD